tara:strand:- start:17818 stop:19005 length:1188 start_codon:yes stop_codon:yes gene_type:complete
MINTNKVKLFEEFAAGEVSNPEQNVAPAAKTTSDTVAVDKVAAEPQGAELRAEIIKDVDTILNNLEALSTRIQENIQNLSKDIKEGVEVDPLVIEAVQSLGVVNEADEPSKIMDILFYAPKARKAMAKVNKIKDNQIAIDLAADNLDGSDEKQKKKKEKLQVKAKKAKEQADELEKTIRDKFADRGKIVKKAITKVDIDGQAERIKKLTGMEDDPKKKKALADQFKEIKTKQKEEEKAIADINKLSAAEKKKLAAKQKELKAKDEAVEVEEVEEGNAFGAARAEAIAKGEDKFKVGDEEYDVEGVDADDKENAKEFADEEGIEVKEKEEASVEEELKGHAKKMKEDGVSDEEIKKMHPEVSDEDLKEEDEVEETSHPEVPHYLSVSEKMKIILKR